MKLISSNYANLATENSHHPQKSYKPSKNNNNIIMKMQSGDNSRSIFGQSILYYVFVKDKLSIFWRLFYRVESCKQSKAKQHSMKSGKVFFFQFPVSLHQQSLFRVTKKIYRHLAFKLNSSLPRLTPCGLPSRRWKLFYKIIDFFVHSDFSYDMRMKMFSFLLALTHSGLVCAV